MPRHAFPARLCLLFILVGLGSAGALAQSSDHTEGLHENRPSAFALTKARVVVSSSQTLESTTVVVRNGRIVAIGGDAPSGTHVIDMSGKTIYPGFIDSFSDTAAPEEEISGSPYWNSNVSPQLDVADFYEPSESTNKSFRNQGFVARLLAPSGGVVKGQSAIVQTSNDPAKRAVLGDGGLHVRLTVQQRFRGGDGSGPSYPNSPMGAYTLARQAFYDTDWYRAALKAVKNDKSAAVPENNDALAAMLPFLDGNAPVIIDSTNELYALRADRFGREFGLNVIINGSGNEYRRLDDVLATGRTVIVPLSFPQPPNVATAESAMNVSLESLMHWDIAPENPARLEKAGVPIVLTSDGLSKRSDFLKNLRKAVARGLTKRAAIDALTMKPAQMFGIDKFLGSIEVGKLASFVVADGDLFDEKTNVVETWVSGTRYDAEEPPQRQIVGDWSLRISRTGRKPSKFMLRVTGDAEKLSAQVSKSGKDWGKATKLSRIGIKDTQISGTFLGDDLGAAGVVRFSAVLTAGDDGVGIGQVVWPDETRSSLKMSRLPAEPSEKEAEESDDQKKKSTRNDPSTYAVNYPLGAYGRDKQPLQQTVLFTNATIWTSGPGGKIEGGSILIQDGCIAAIGKNIEAPRGVRVIDLEGKHVSPGIIDCHSHMATDGGVNESGQAITAEVRIGDFIDSDDISIYRQLAGGVTSSNILHGSANPIGGQNQVIKLRWGANPEAMKFSEAPQGIKFALGENVKQSNWSNPTGRYPQTRMGVEQIFRDEFQTAIEYRKRWKTWKANRRGLPPRYDLELEAIAEIVEGNRWIHCHSYRQDEILALIRVLDDYDITIGSFQHILEGYKVADAMAKHGATGSAFADWWAYKVEVYDAIPYAGALMHNQGVVVSFNSDDAELATHLNQEAAKAVKYGGVAPEEALKFVTLNPAKQLRIDQHVGSLEVGKDADLVVWNGSPLSNFARAEQTWVDGRKYFDRSDDAKHRQKIREMRAKLVQKILISGEKMREPGVGDGDPAALWPREDLFCGHHHSHGHDHSHE